MTISCNDEMEHETEHHLRIVT